MSVCLCSVLCVCVWGGCMCGAGAQAWGMLGRGKHFYLAVSLALDFLNFFFVLLKHKKYTHLWNAG